MKPSPTASRRHFLKIAAASTGLTVMGVNLGACTQVHFLHGVASGDPLQDRVILWTRVTPMDEDRLLVRWEIARDRHFRDLVDRGQTFTDASVDYTVKVDAEALQAGQHYYYRFSCNGQHSPIGQTRTLPSAMADKVKLAVLSCSNYPAGYFNVCREVNQRAKDIDFVVHLGDYIYEYDKDGYASEDAVALGRVVEPEHEVLTLADYRQRHAQYRTDPDLQALHQALPWIVVWDDHEIANDAWREGAENHNPGEGEFINRRAQALQAYHEWLAVREIEPDRRERIFRSFDFGNVLTLHMLDTRVIARDQQLAYANYLGADGSFDAVRFNADLNDPNRTLLGAEQVAWLQENMQRSSATWQVLGQQVLMTAIELPGPLLFQQLTFEAYQALVVKALNTPELLTDEERAILTAPRLPFNLDAWDGYPAAREQVFQVARSLGKNLIALAGDTHNAWASNLSTREGEAVGVELATPSVSSPGLEVYLPTIAPDVLAVGLLGLLPNLRYTNTQHRGYLEVTASASEAVGEWIYIDTVKSHDYTVLHDRNKRLRVLPGAGNLQLIEA